MTILNRIARLEQRKINEKKYAYHALSQTTETRENVLMLFYVRVSFLSVKILKWKKCYQIKIDVLHRV